MFEYFCLTAKGAALLAKAQTGETLTFTRFQIGDGEIPVGAAMSDTAALVHPLMYLQIAGLTHSGSTATIKTTFANAGASSDFWWREVGLLAQDPVEGEILYAYANAGDKADHIPAPSSTAVSFAFAMIAKVDNAKQVSAVIDPSVVFVTDKMLKDYATKSDLAQALEEKAPLVHTHGTEEITGFAKALSTKADRPELFAATMRAAKWTGDAPPYTQTLLLPTEGIVAIGLTATATEEEIKVCRAARIELVETANSVITAKAMGVKPGIDIKISATQIV
jgi:hypothetical protein